MVKDRVFIVLDDEDLERVTRLKDDRDGEQALAFLKERVLPQAHKKVPCLEGRLKQRKRAKGRGGWR